MKATGTSAPLTGSIDRVLPGGCPRGSVQRRREAPPVLAGELVVGAELGEDPDHHRPQQVAPVRVARLGDQLLQRLERGLVVARVPGGEGARQARIELAVAVGLREPGAGREALGDEISLERLQQLQRLACRRPGRPATCPARRRLRGAPGSISSALRSDASSPTATSSSAGDGTSPSSQRSICAGGIAPVNSATTWPSRNAFTAGIPWTPKLAESDWFESTSTFASSTLPAALSDRRLERRPELAARAAPLGPEVDDDRQLARALDHRGHEIGFAHVLDHDAIEVSDRAELSRWPSRIETTPPRRSTRACAGAC